MSTADPPLEGDQAAQADLLLERFVRVRVLREAVPGSPHDSVFMLVAWGLLFVAAVVVIFITASDLAITILNTVPEVVAMVAGAIAIGGTMAVNATRQRLTDRGEKAASYRTLSGVMQRAIGIHGPYTAVTLVAHLGPDADPDEIERTLRAGIPPE